MKRIISALLLLPCLVGAAQTRQLSVRDFLRLSEKDTTSYTVSGVVEKIRSSSSGSFYLNDGTGSLLVYGIQDPAAPGVSFDGMDIKRGDTLTVIGRFTVYGGTTKEMNDGRLIRKADGPDHDLSFYDRLEKRPSFKGKEGKEGLDAFSEWVQAHLQYPTGESGTGKVVVRFIVGRNGGVQEVQVVKGLSPAFDEEAVRVVKSSPKWKPGKDNGSPVRVTYNLSVVFN